MKKGEKIYRGIAINRRGFKETGIRFSPIKEITSGATIYSAQGLKVEYIVETEHLGSLSTSYFTFPTHIEHRILDTSGELVDLTFGGIALKPKITFLKSAYSHDQGKLSFRICDKDGKTIWLKDEAVVELQGRDNISKALSIVRELKEEFYGSWDLHRKFSPRVKELGNRIKQLEQENKKLNATLRLLQEKEDNE